MGFYEQISKYYDYIFPVGLKQVEFIENSLTEKGSKVLDVACGSGGYSVELAKRGYRVTAVDIEQEMVTKAKGKSIRENVDIEVYKADMRQLKSLIREKMDVIFCIGNSIVHLGGLKEIREALEQMYDLLGTNGSLVLQIINYDRILKYNLSELPAIKNEDIGLEFVRKYDYVKDKNVVNFNTTLTVRNDSDTIKYNNSIELFPIMKDDFETVLKEVGFKVFDTYGDFEYTPYSDESYMVVIRATKK